MLRIRCLDVQDATAHEHRPGPLSRLGWANRPPYPTPPRTYLLLANGNNYNSVPASGFADPIADLDWSGLVQARDYRG